MKQSTVLRTAPASMSVLLEIAVVGRQLTAFLTFSNQSDEIEYLEKVNAAAGRVVTKNLFWITDEQGNRLPYTGILAKRRAPRPEDFITLEPGQRHAAQVRLDDLYRFPDGPGSYRARYSAYNSSPDHSSLSKLLSNEATFALD